MIPPMEAKRTDEQILNEILTGLTNNPRFDARGIEVRVIHGEVYLDGFVDTWESRRSANDIADHVSGVVKVHNNLALKPAEKPD